LDNVNPTTVSHLVEAIKIGQNSKSGLIQDRSKEVANLLTKMKK
jgi:hypothetical protein